MNRMKTLMFLATLTAPLLWAGHALRKIEAHSQQIPMPAGSL